MFFGVVSILVGSLGALYQVKIKRLLAFSAVAIWGTF
jgi:formate hydrogenlyase subunit 3/multisubunit Na+/H+ antiporter MnhD subunit